MHRNSRRRAMAALSGLAVAAATAVTGGAVATAASGVLTPAIGAHPHYILAGHAPKADPAAATFSCQTTAPPSCYGPDQIKAAYGISQVSSQLHLTGAGKTIVIVDAYQSPTITDDLATFDTTFGLPAPKFNIIAPDGLTPFDGDPDQTSWSGEISLDVEWAHAIAPGATIDLVLSKSDQDADIYSAQKYVVDHNLGDVLSQSFGEAEQCMDPTIFAETHALFAKAAAEHMTVFASSADNGAALPSCANDGTFIKAVSTPASDPDVTGVGGTILDADGTTGAYHSETAWNEPEYPAGGGGGFSSKYSTPDFQRSLKLPTRGVPDISYNAAINSGVLTAWTSSGIAGAGPGSGAIFIFGGTSAGSPQWSGIAALTDQLGRHRIGDINNELYLYSHSKLVSGQVYHDVTTGDNTYTYADPTTGDPVTIQGYSAKPGWDAATGLGSPKAQALIPLLAVTAW